MRVADLRTGNRSSFRNSEQGDASVGRPNTDCSVIQFAQFTFTPLLAHTLLISGLLYTSWKPFGNFKIQKFSTVTLQTHS